MVPASEDDLPRVSKYAQKSQGNVAWRQNQTCSVDLRREDAE